MATLTPPQSEKMPGLTPFLCLLLEFAQFIIEKLQQSSAPGSADKMPEGHTGRDSNSLCN